MGAHSHVGLAALAIALTLALVVTAKATALPNPANDKRLLGKPIENLRYDPGTRCSRKPKPGMRALVGWLERNWAGQSWGTYRCEKWGRGSFSVHSEGRAVDWHLDARRRSQKRAAMRLIHRLLETDRAGNPVALARRMGVQGIIFNCRSWFSSPEGRLGGYSYCERRNGKQKPRRRLDPTQAHIDHLHIELNKRGSRGKTSFWRSRFA